MDLITILIVLIVVGALLYVVDQTVPMDPGIKTIIRVVVILVVLLWLVRVFLGGTLVIPRMGLG